MFCFQGMKFRKKKQRDQELKNLQPKRGIFQQFDFDEIVLL